MDWQALGGSSFSSCLPFFQFSKILVWSYPHTKRTRIKTSRGATLLSV